MIIKTHFAINSSEQNLGISYQYYFNLTYQETEAQRSDVTCPKFHTQEGEESDFLISEPVFLATAPSPLCYWCYELDLENKAL